MFGKLFEIYCSSKGQISRSAFWRYVGGWVLVFVFLTFVVFGTLTVHFGHLGRLAFSLFVLLSLPLTLMPVYVKRGRDFGLSALVSHWLFLSVIVFPVFVVVTLVFGIKRD